MDPMGSHLHPKFSQKFPFQKSSHSKGCNSKWFGTQGFFGRPGPAASDDFSFSPRKLVKMNPIWRLHIFQRVGSTTNQSWFTVFLFKSHPKLIIGTVRWLITCSGSVYFFCVPYNGVGLSLKFHWISIRKTWYQQWPTRLMGRKEE